MASNRQTKKNRREKVKKQTKTSLSFTFKKASHERQKLQNAQKAKQ
jgi:hypothetical protein